MRILDSHQHIRIRVPLSPTNLSNDSLASEDRSLATFACKSDNPSRSGIPDAAQQSWASCVIVVALVLSVLSMLNLRDFEFGLAVIWATIGIALNRMDMSVIFAIPIVTTAVLEILISTALLLRKGIVYFYVIHAQGKSRGLERSGESRRSDRIRVSIGLQVKVTYF